MRVLDAGRWVLSTDRVDCHSLSTMTRDSFHVYNWTFRSFVLILFHAYERSHTVRTEHPEAHQRSMASDYNLSLAMKLLVGVLARPQDDR